MSICTRSHLESYPPPPQYLNPPSRCPGPWLHMSSGLQVGSLSGHRKLLLRFLGHLIIFAQTMISQHCKLLGVIAVKSGAPRK